MSEKRGQYKCRPVDMLAEQVADHSPHRVTLLPAMPLVIMHKTGRVISGEGTGCRPLKCEQ